MFWRLKIAEHTPGCRRDLRGSSAEHPQLQLPKVQGVPWDSAGHNSSFQQQRGAGSSFACTVWSDAANSCSSRSCCESLAAADPGSSIPSPAPAPAPAGYSLLSCLHHVNKLRSVSLPSLPSHARALCPKIQQCPKICSQNTKSFPGWGFCAGKALYQSFKLLIQAPGYPGSQPSTSTGIPRDMKAQERLRSVFSGKLPRLLSPSWTAQTRGMAGTRRSRAGSR